MAISAEPLTFSPSETTPRLRGMPGASRLRPWRLRHHRAPTWTWLRRPPPPKQKTAGLWSRRRSARTALLCNVCNCADFSPWAAHGRISPTPRRARARRWTEPAPERDQQSPEVHARAHPPATMSIASGAFFQRSARCRSDAWARLDYRARVCASALRCHCARATTGQARLFRARARSASLRRFVRC